MAHDLEADGEQAALAADGWVQRSLPLPPVPVDQAAALGSARRVLAAATGAPVRLGDCPVRCEGTMGCLCGQGELSDDPLWIEND